MKKEMAFPVSEYQNRLAKVRAIMNERQLDVLLVFNPVSTNYLTGYQTHSVANYQCLVVPIDGLPSILVWELELPGVELTSILEDGTYYRTGEDKFEATRALLDRLGLHGATIGLEKDSSYTTAQDVERLVHALATYDLADGSGITRKVMRVKSRQEIDHLREAGKITAKGMRAAVEASIAGAEDNEVAAASHQAMIAAGSEYPAGSPIVTTGSRSGIPHTNFLRTRIEHGDAVLIELGGCYWRYTAPLMRTVFVGTPPEGAVRLADASVEALQAVMSTVRPGISAEEVALAGAERLPLDDNVVFHHTYGYSVGLGFPPTWADDAALTLIAGSQTLLEPGMVFHSTMSLRSKGRYGVAISETFAVTEDGCELLTEFPQEYFFH